LQSLADSHALGETDVRVYVPAKEEAADAWREAMPWSTPRARQARARTAADFILAGLMLLLMMLLECWLVVAEKIGE